MRACQNPESSLASWILAYNFGNVAALCSFPYFGASGACMTDPQLPKTDKKWQLSGRDVLELRGALIDNISTIVVLPLKMDLKKSLQALKGIFETARSSPDVPANERYNKLCQATTAELDRFGIKASSEQTEWLHQCFQMISNSSRTEEDIRSVEKDFHAIFAIYRRWLYRLNFCCTFYDRFAWVPESSEVGDKICIIQGAKVPFVLRQQGNGKYSLLGECWVEGVMRGEALSLPGFKWERISLV